MLYAMSILIHVHYLATACGPSAFDRRTFVVCKCKQRKSTTTRHIVSSTYLFSLLIKPQTYDRTSVILYQRHQAPNILATDFECGRNKLLPNITMADQDISSDFPFTMHYEKVAQDVEMAYIDIDQTRILQSPPVLFLHGNPACSYLWRNIIPHVMSTARCIAPNLIGMGLSSKLPSDGYGWENHNRYLDAFFSQVLSSDEKVVLVLHDFGSLFGLNWARRHPDRIASLVLMEFIPPMASWKNTGNMSDELQKAPGGSPEHLLKSIMDDNVFIEFFLQDQVIRTLSQKELDCYRKPFLHRTNRESLYEMSKLFPAAGNPPEVYKAVEDYNSWLLESEIPKLFFSANPGKIMPPNLAKYYSENLKNSRSVAVGNAKHYLQEDHPDLIGNEIQSWLQTSGIIGGEK